MTGSMPPRLWWFPEVPGLDRRGGVNGGTYSAFPLDEQPPIAADPDLGWLRIEPEAHEWQLDNSDASPQRPLSSASLSHVLPPSAAPPPALRTLAEEPVLQRRIRSYTGCYFDLGDRAVPTDDGRFLLHLLSDQQWVRHWLVLVGGQDAPVLSTTSPIGFDLPEDWGEAEGELPVPLRVPLDESADLSVVADSAEEFLYRFWAENEIAFRSADGQRLPDRLAAYAAGLHRSGG